MIDIDIDIDILQLALYINIAYIFVAFQTDLQRPSIIILVHSPHVPITTQAENCFVQDEVGCVVRACLLIHVWCIQKYATRVYGQQLAMSIG